jgi:hypothetical protein
MSAPFYYDVDFTKMHVKSLNKSGTGHVGFISPQEGVFGKMAMTLGTMDAPLVAPHGISNPINDKADPTKRSCSLSITDPRMLAYFDAFDEYIIKYVAAHINTWLPRKGNLPPYTEDDVRSCYMPMIKRDLSGTYPPSLNSKTRIESTDGKQQIVQVWEQTKDKTGVTKTNNWRAVGKHSKNVAVIEPMAIFIANADSKPQARGLPESINAMVNITHIITAKGLEVAEFAFAAPENAPYKIVDPNIEFRPPPLSPTLSQAPTTNYGGAYSGGSYGAYAGATNGGTYADDGSGYVGDDPMA